MDVSSVLRPQFNKKRKPNWSENEISFLLREFEKHKVILTSKLCGETTSQQKRYIWRIICDDLNARNPYVKRTTEEVRRKWKNLLSASKRELLESKRPYMEGGPPPRPISSISRRVINLRGKPTIRRPNSPYIHPAAVVEPGSDSHPDSNYHTSNLPTMVHVMHCSSNRDDSDEFDDLDGTLDDNDGDDIGDDDENIIQVRGNSPLYCSQSENASSIVETKFTPPPHRTHPAIHANHQQPSVDSRVNSKASETANPSTTSISTSSSISRPIATPIPNGSVGLQNHVGLVQNGGSVDLSKSNGLSSLSSSPYSDTEHHHPNENAMFNFQAMAMPEGYPVFPPVGRMHPGYAMYHPIERTRTDDALPHASRSNISANRFRESGKTVAEIQAEMLELQRDKLRLEKEVLELYKERMKMEVEWWRKRVEQSLPPGSNTQTSNTD